MSKNIYKTVSLVLLVSWMLLIFILSAQSAVESAGLSKGLTYKVFMIFYPDFRAMTEQARQTAVESASFFVRKAAHFTIYFFLGAFSFFAFTAYKSIGIKLRIIISYAVCFIYAVTDELHQCFVSGRSCEIRDILIDALGSLLAVLILTVICYKSKKLSKIIK